MRISARVSRHTRVSMGPAGWALLILAGGPLLLMWWALLGCGWLLLMSGKLIVWVIQQAALRVQQAPQRRWKATR